MEGGLPTATTYFKKHKISKGETIAQSLKERFDYGQNPDKTEGGELISSYGCDHMTADAEFLLSKAKYKAATGREQRRDADVLCYQIRQSFKPGEITPEEANRIGYETAMRWTKGKYAFFVATHTDKAHIHNHIYYNSTSLDCTRKFRDFIGSAVRCGGFLTAFALKMICPSSPIPSCTARGDFSITGRGWGQRGRAISFLVPGQERATRLRASTLGDGYDPEDIKAVIAGERPIPEQPVSVSAAPRRVNLIVDIQERLRSGKGAAYARWAKVYNLKQMAAALQFMQEQNITDYDQLSAKAEDAVSRFHSLTEQLRRTEADLSATSELMGAVVQYAKTRPVFDGYKAAKYSRKFLAEHEAELADYRAAKATMGELLGGEKLPKMTELKEKRRQLAARKKALYTEYRSAQEEMRQAVAVKANIDHLLGVTDGQHKKEQER